MIELNYTVATGIIAQEYLDANNITIEDLIRESGCNSFYIGKFLQGKAVLTERVVQALNKLLSINTIAWYQYESHNRSFMNLKANKKRKIPLWTQ